MMRSLGRYVALGLGLFASGTACAMALPHLADARGVTGPMLQSSAPLRALLVTISCVAVATVIGIVVARVLNAVAAMFIVGAGLVVIAHRSGTIVDLAFANGSIGMLGIETLAWAVIILVATAVLFHFSPPLDDLADPEPDTTRPGPFSRQAAIAALTGLATLPLVWLWCRTSMTGQTIFATFLGGLVTGLAGRLISPSTSPVLLFVAPVVVGAIGHFLAAIMFTGDLTRAPADGTIPALAFARPIDFAAGSLMGVAVGFGWAKSFLHGEHHDEPLPRTSGGAAKARP